MEIVSKIRRLMGDKRGLTMFTPALAILISTMFLALLCHFIDLYTITGGIINYTQKAVLQTATSNAYNAYIGVREGNSSAHYYAGSGMWQELVSTAEMSASLQQMLRLTRSGNSLRKYDASGNLQYTISNIQVYCSNVSVGTGGGGVRLTFRTTATAEIPRKFLGVTIIVREPISLISYFTPRF